MAARKKILVTNISTNKFKNHENLEKERRMYERCYVKKLKGLYIHAAVYVLVNAGLFTAQSVDNDGGSYTDQFNTLFFWGIGLAVQACSVFLPNFLFGKEWEQRKIQQFIDRNQ